MLCVSCSARQRPFGWLDKTGVQEMKLEWCLGRCRPTEEWPILWKAMLWMNVSGTLAKETVAAIFNADTPSSQSSAPVSPFCIRYEECEKCAVRVEFRDLEVRQLLRQWENRYTWVQRWSDSETNSIRHHWERRAWHHRHEHTSSHRQILSRIDKPRAS